MELRLNERCVALLKWEEDEEKKKTRAASSSIPDAMPSLLEKGRPRDAFVFHHRP